MSRTFCARVAGAALFVGLSFTALPASAQIDLMGQWQAINQQDAHTRGPGPDLADWTGMPLNAEGKALSVS